MSSRLCYACEWWYSFDRQEEAGDLDEWKQVTHLWGTCLLGSEPSDELEPEPIARRPDVTWMPDPLKVGIPHYMEKITGGYYGCKHWKESTPLDDGDTDADSPTD